jgi:hypothetical protein
LYGDGIAQARGFAQEVLDLDLDPNAGLALPFVIRLDLDDPAYR